MFTLKLAYAEIDSHSRTWHDIIYESRWWYSAPFIPSFIQRNFFPFHSFSFVLCCQKIEKVLQSSRHRLPVWDIFIAIRSANDFDKLVSDDIWKIYYYPLNRSFVCSLWQRVDGWVSSQDGQIAIAVRKWMANLIAIGVARTETLFAWITNECTYVYSIRPHHSDVAGGFGSPGLGWKWELDRE